MAETILAVEDLTMSYGSGAGRLDVLRNATFSLRPGETLALVGPSGSGKTTLLGLCAGLDTPTSGRVLLAGSDLGRLDEEGRAKVRLKHVGFIFQNFQLLSSLTALENAQLALELRGAADPGAGARQWLKAVGLGDRLEHYPGQLSGGEQQRVAMARAFAGQPGLLFADEPTGNLDEATAARVADLLFGLHAEAGAALVLVTHNPELAARCQRRFRLRAGALEEA